jgi:hypothetical protein
MGSSNSKSDSESLDWNKHRTEDFSSVLPMQGGVNTLSPQAYQLLSNIIPNSLSQLTTTSELSVIKNMVDKMGDSLNESDKKMFGKFLSNISEETSERQSGGKQTTEELSDTSPFITSEMYESFNKKTNQQGGSRKLVKRGGKLNDLNDDSDTSSTSSDSDLEDIIDSSDDSDLSHEVKEKPKHKQHETPQRHQQHNKQQKQQKHEKKNQTDSELSGGELSYLSSSAHTDRNFSDESSASSASNKQQETQTSVTDENKYVNTTSASVNTTDINMVSDY